MIPLVKGRKKTAITWKPQKVHFWQSSVVFGAQRNVVICSKYRVSTIILVLQ
jgi:hypothetical protein